MFSEKKLNSYLLTTLIQLYHMIKTLQRTFVVEGHNIKDGPANYSRGRPSKGPGGGPPRDIHGQGPGPVRARHMNNNI